MAEAGQAGSAPAGWERAEREALDALQRLLRIDTTNPPGRETAAAELCAQLLRAAGLEPRLIARVPERANVIARLAGDGTLPPLLLNAHLDVVPAEAESWTHPPFAGEIHGGWVWGRGSVDMKNMAALSIAVLAQLKREGVRLRRDVIFCGSADEEAGSRDGALWLVEKHPELVRAEYGLGEVGGFSMHLGSTTFYPVMVAQKGVCWFTLRAHGPTGHGSIPRRDGAVPKLARAVERLGSARLPAHVTPQLQAMVRAMAQGARGPIKAVLPLLASELAAPRLLDALGDRGFTRSFGALLSNTASPTLLRAGTKANVHPSVAECVVDGRVLPGQTREEFLREVRAVVGEEVELDVFQEQPSVVMPGDTPLFDEIAASIAELEPGAKVIPYLIPGYTDAWAFSKLGCVFYGFVPVRLPRDGPAFAELFHAHDERIPVDGFLWGLRALHRVVKGFCQRG